MQKYISWQDDQMFFGYIEDYPDYWTQGETRKELEENLIDIDNELTGGTISCIRRVDELALEATGCTPSTDRQHPSVAFVFHEE